MSKSTLTSYKPFVSFCQRRVYKPFALTLLVLAIAGTSFTSSASASMNSAALGAVFAANYSSSDFTYFPKWTRIMNKLNADSYTSQASCSDNNPYHCNLQRWKDTLAALEGKSLSEKLSGVNSFVNSFRYIEDQNNYGSADYWQTPAEFFSRNGDCEDFAIVKYTSLLKLGVPASSMRIVILNDQNLGLLHAVLAVETGSETMILDNQLNNVVAANSIHHYQPIFSINQQGWWRHQVQSATVM